MDKIDFKRDKKLLRLLLDPKNERIIRHIRTKDDHRVRTIARNGMTRQTVLNRIRALKKAGVLRVAVDGSGAKPAIYALQKRAAAIIEELET